jgi:Ca-activated chloride channel family protein
MSEDLSKLDLVGLLDLLEPVPEPDPISLWPQTAGWIWLGLAIAAGLLLLIHQLRRRRRRDAYRREALTALEAAGGDPVAIAAILRRTALAAYPRRDVASLHGPDWLAFLDQTYDGSGFANGPGRFVVIAPYVTVDVPAALGAVVKDWIRTHKPIDGTRP